MMAEDKLYQTCIWKRSSHPWPPLTSSIDHLPIRALQQSLADRHRARLFLRGLPELRRDFSISTCDGRKTSSGSPSSLHATRSIWYVPLRSDTHQEPSRARWAVELSRYARHKRSRREQLVSLYTCLVTVSSRHGFPFTHLSQFTLYTQTHIRSCRDPLITLSPLLHS